MSLKIWNIAKLDDLSYLPVGLDDMGFVYALEYGDCVKIGRTQNLRERIGRLLHQARCYSRVQSSRVAYSKRHSNYADNEIILHDFFRDKRINGRELFNLSLSDFLRCAPDLMFKIESSEEIVKGYLKKIDSLMPIATMMIRENNNGLSSPEEIYLSNIERNTIKAEILQHSFYDDRRHPLSIRTKLIIVHEILKLATGHSYLAMLPNSMSGCYTAEDIAEELNINADKVTQIARAGKIIPHEEESNKYGRWMFSKDRDSNRETASFIYSDAGLEWFKEQVK